jgi:hypothetical protein
MNLQTVFSDLIEKYPSSDALLTFLSSEEGGSLRVIRSARYAIIRYTKGVSNLLAEWVPWFRSVIWDCETNRPVVVSPPKAFVGEPNPKQINRIEEFLEGTMVNCFLDHEGNIVWCTRTSLGANNGFYEGKRFSELIEDAMVKDGITNGALKEKLSYGGAKRCMSFVLQHPEHKVVQYIEVPTLSLVQICELRGDGSFKLMSSPDDWSPEEDFTAWNHPQKYEFLGIHETPLDRMKTLTEVKPPTWQGLVFRSYDGRRWRMRTPTYKILRVLRGQEARDEERFARLRKNGQIHTYLLTWPRDQERFWSLEAKLRDLTAMAYAEYCAVHKEKTKQIKDVSIHLRTVVYELHGIYINQLRPAEQTLRMANTIHYMNNLSPEILGRMLRFTVPPAAPVEVPA